MSIRLRMDLIITLLIVSLFSGTTSAQGQTSEPFPFLTTAGLALTYKGQTVYLRGENFNNLPAAGAKIGSGDIEDINVGEADYARLSTLGANHVRFGLFFNWYTADSAKFFEVVDQHITWARTYHLWFVPVLFTTPRDCYEGFSNSCDMWNNAYAQDDLLNFWVDFAVHYKNDPTIAGYDLLNEPTPPASISKQWFPLAQKIYDALSTVDPNHLVFVESGSDAQFEAFKGSRVVYEVHDYLPMSLTHRPSSSSKYPGWAPDWRGINAYWDRAAFAGQGDPRANLRKKLSIDWAQQNKVPLYIGEWGTRNGYAGYDTYVADRFALYNEWKVHYAHFVWRSGPGKFGIYPLRGPLEVQDPLVLDQVQVGWKDSVKPSN